MWMKHARLAAAIVALEMATAGAAAVATAHGGDVSKIHGCRATSGVLRVIGAAATCGASETPVDWSKGAIAGTGLTATPGVGGTTLGIADGGVTSAHLAPNAATQQQSVSQTSSSTTSAFAPQDIPGMSVSLTTTGGPVLVLFSASFRSGTGSETGFWRIVRDGTVVLGQTTHTFAATPGAPEWTTITLFGMDASPAGAHTYKAQWWVNSGGMSSSDGVYTENLAAIELKR